MKDYRGYSTTRPDLVLRWFHYAMFGLKLDAEQFETLRLLYLDGNGFPPTGVVYYFFPAGVAGGKEGVPGTQRTMSELRPFDDPR